MGQDIDTGTTRRSLLRTAFAALAGAIVGAAARPDATLGADGQAMTLGAVNTATAETALQATSGVGYAFRATSELGGGVGGFSTDSIGIVGQSTTSTGVFGNSQDGYGVDAASMNGWAARAMSSYGLGLYARLFDNTPSTFSDSSVKSAIVAVAGDATNEAANTDEVGVYGFSDISANSTGVWGDSTRGVGVAGTGDWGVYGLGRVGVYAQSTSSTGYALYTKGRISFSGRSGRSSITSGHTYKDVPISGMTSSSAVIATLQTHVTGTYVASVVSYTGKFRVYLNKSATSTLAFSYLVIN